MSENRTLKITFWSTILAMAIDGFKQYVEIQKGTKEKFDAEEFVRWGLGGVGIGLGTGLVLDYVDEDEDEQHVFRETRYLRKVLADADPAAYEEYDFYMRKTGEIAGAIQEEFDEVCLGPELSGSHAKGTAVAGSSDVDLVVPFQKYSFSSTEEMFEAVYEFLDEYRAGDPEIRKIRKQSKSIGILCRHGDFESWIDVVPARERDDYFSDGELTLHVRAKDVWSSATYTKTNIHKHKEVVQGCRSKRDVIRLLKVWKTAHGVNVSGFELELLVAQAYDFNVGKMPRTLFGKVLSCVQHIFEHVCSTPLHDPGVSTKRLLDDPDKQNHVRKHVGKMLYEISDDPTTLTKWFPGNT